MNEQIHIWIQSLEREWARSDGFLGKARGGVFDAQQGESFVSMLESIEMPTNGMIDRRFVALIWYIPTFLRWQKERITENGENSFEFEQLTNRTQAVIENLLGIP